MVGMAEYFPSGPPNDLESTGRPHVVLDHRPRIAARPAPFPVPVPCSFQPFDASRIRPALDARVADARRSFATFWDRAKKILQLRVRSGFTVQVSLFRENLLLALLRILERSVPAAGRR